MRFLAHENDDMRRCLAEAGRDISEFQVVKRQGKLHFFHPDHASPFKFFRKKETRLGAGGKWQDVVVYLIYPNGKATEVNGWEEVLEAFQGWLDELG